jgi:glycine/D-amino acid oxidase-like deaminating enzyme
VSTGADVVIIGAGVEGLSTARALVERGIRQVVVVERSTIGSGGTGKSSGVVRCHYGIRSLAAMAWKAQPVLEHAPEILGDDAGFHRTGYVVGVGEDNVAALDANLDMQRSLGIEVERVDHDVVQRLLPAAYLEDFAAFAYEPRGGYGDAYQTAQAFATAARRGGATIRQQTPVAGIETERDRVKGVRLASGELIEAHQVVVAAGPWSVALVAPLGIDLPIRAQRAQILLVDPGPAVEPVPVLSDLVTLQYVRSEGRSALLVGDSDHSQPEWADPDQYADRADDEYLEVAIPKFEHRFPKWQECRLSSSYAGCYDVTPDYNPIIGSSPVEGLYLCAGFSGHGYKISPSVGELVADLLCDDQSQDPDIDHRDFRLARFAEDDLLRSPHPYVGAGQMR